MRHTITWSAICAFILCAAAGGCAQAADYHVSPAGSDANPGTQDAPWQTIAKANAADLQPGDRVLFEGGETFAGTIELDADDSGAAGNRVAIGSYGDGRATIDGGNGSALISRDCSHLLINDLAFVGAGRKTGNTENGVHLTGGQDIELTRLDISGFRTSGLLLMSVRDAWVTFVYAHDNGATGITVGTGEPEWSENVYIAQCLAENNPGDPSNLDNHSGSGIVVGCVRNCLIEYCEATNNGWDMPPRGNGPVGIWTWNADRVVIQFCVSHDNKTTGGDGGGFDIDGGVTNSIVQYNYSYQNMGPGILLCQYPTALAWKNNIIRYNISVNDGHSKYPSGGIAVYGGDERMSDAEVYNNTVYNTVEGGVVFGGIPPPGIRFRNNIFITGKGDMIRGECSHARFEGNLYWLVAPDGAIAGDHKTLEEWAEATGQEIADGKLLGMFADPLLTRAGTMPYIEPTDLPGLGAYHLREGSPCLGAGIPIPDNGGRDLWGKAVPENANPSIGACQRP